jgi:hypothetical protein
MELVVIESVFVAAAPGGLPPRRTGSQMALLCHLLPAAKPGCVHGAPGLGWATSGRGVRHCRAAYQKGLHFYLLVTA